MVRPVVVQFDCFREALVASRHVRRELGFRVAAVRAQTVAAREPSRGPPSWTAAPLLRRQMRVVYPERLGLVQLQLCVQTFQLLLKEKKEQVKET